MSKDEVKKIFFELLAEDEEFQRKLTKFILNAVAEKFVERVAQVEESPQVEVDEPEAEEKNSTEEFAENVAELIEERNEANRQLEELRREKISVEGERNEAQRQLEELRCEKNSVEGERNEANRQLEELRREKISVEEERDDLKHQLDERFSEGWEVYQKFLRIDADARKESGIYSGDFVSFICSGAQMKRLESIWEAALDCKRTGNFDDAEIFFEVFKYCVRLVNAAQGDKVIELLNTQLGDRYDTDKHSTGGTNSAAQGVVREIILVGYRNNISKKTIKKSNVRVG